MKYLQPFVLLFPFLIGQAYAGGGWPQPRGHGFFKLSQWWVIADQHYTGTGLIDPNVTNGIFNTSFYGEYGFTDRITGVVYFPFFSRAYFNKSVSATTGEVLQAGEAINSIGDTDVSVTYGLAVNKPVVISATLTLGLPLGVDDGGSGQSLQTGDGEFNQMLRLDASTARTFGRVNTFYTAYAGFNNRTNGFSDELRFGMEAGGSFFNDKLLLILRLYGVRSLRNGVSGPLPANTSIFANNSEHLTFSPEIGYQLTDRVGVSATYGQALAGRIIFANPSSYSLGVFFKL